MTPYQRKVKDKRYRGECIDCASDAESGKLRCPEHAEENRRRWRAWAAENPTKPCSDCGKRSMRGNCRCAPCREKNRARCAAWKATRGVLR